MRSAKCPECGAQVRVSSAADVGDEVTCQSCGEELEVLDTEPLTLGYLGDYDDLEDEDEFDDLEDEDFDDDDDWDDFDDDDDDF